VPVGESLEAPRKTANGPKRFFRATSLPYQPRSRFKRLKAKYGPSRKTTDVGSFSDFELSDCLKGFLQGNHVVILLRRLLLAVNDDPAL
jgi:hypothetical protein